MKIEINHVRVPSIMSYCDKDTVKDIEITVKQKVILYYWHGRFVLSMRCSPHSEFIDRD